MLCDSLKLGLITVGKVKTWEISLIRKKTEVCRWVEDTPPSTKMSIIIRLLDSWSAFDSSLPALSQGMTPETSGMYLSSLCINNLNNICERRSKQDGTNVFFVLSIWHTKKIKLPDKPCSKGNLTHSCPHHLWASFFLKITPFYSEDVTGESSHRQDERWKNYSQKSSYLMIPKSSVTRGDCEKFIFPWKQPKYP